MENLIKRLKLDSKLEPETRAWSQKEKAYRKCDCGYVPNGFSSHDKCPIKLALHNHISFPSFELMTELDDPSTIYYNMDYICGPKRHWAAILQIKNNISFMRPGIIGVNQFGEEVLVHFYHDKDEIPMTFSWDDLREDYTLAILYPEKKTFMDGTQGIREENLDFCFVFKANLDDLREEAQKLLNDFDGKSKDAYESSCFTCGVKKVSMNQCSKCKLAKYCSKVGF